MVLANRIAVVEADPDPAAAERRVRAAREVRERAALYGIGDGELRRLLDEVERERGREAALAQRAAEQADRRARQHALHIARQLVEFWGIEARELVGGGTPPPRRAENSVKYRHPVSGETWDGEGPQPEWLRRALGPEGYRVAELQPGSADHERAAAGRP